MDHKIPARHTIRSANLHNSFTIQVGTGSPFSIPIMSTLTTTDIEEVVRKYGTKGSSVKFLTNMVQIASAFYSKTGKIIITQNRLEDLRSQLPDYNRDNLGDRIDYT